MKPPLAKIGWTKAAGWGWVLLAAGFSFWLCWRDVFYSGHDHWDDSGYMLSIFDGIRRYGIGGLYTEVYSQYGPAHVLPWLTYLNVFGFEVSHDHVAFGVLALWWSTSVGAGLLVWRITSSRWGGGLAIFVSAMSAPMQGELGHPKSMCALLVIVILLGVTFFESERRRWLGPLISGVALAWLGMTKINLGALATFGLLTPVFFQWAGSGPFRRWVVAFALTAFPAWLLKPVWPLDGRLMSGASMLLPLWVLLFLPQKRETGQRRWSKYERMVVLTLVVATFASLAIVAGLALAGLNVSDLVDGMILRPLVSVGGFSVPPAYGNADFLVLGIFVVLALALFPLGPCGHPDFWRTVGVLSPAALFFFFQFQLPLAAMAGVWIAGLVIKFKSGGRHLIGNYVPSVDVFVCVAAWQLLGIFPVAGAQVTLPRLLLALLLIVTVSKSAKEWQGNLPLRIGVQGFATVLFIAGFASWWEPRFENLERRNRAHVTTPLEGTGSFNWSTLQTGELEFLVANLRRHPGPLFTFHGQHSLDFWTRKDPPTGLNCTWISGLLSPEEWDRIKKAYEKEPSRLVLVGWNGMGLGTGPRHSEISQWISEGTKSWIKFRDHEIRVSSQAILGEPVVHFLRRKADGFEAFAPATALREAETYRFHSRSKVTESLDLSELMVSPIEGLDDYRLLSIGPSDLPGRLDRLKPPYLVLVLLDVNGHALCSLPIRDED